MKKVLKHKTSSGYILLLTLMILSLAIVLVTYMFNRSIVAIPYDYAIIKREKAKLLALSGVQIAMAQLGKKIELKKTEKKTESKDEAQSPPEEQAAKQFLLWLLPVIYQWQQFDLKDNPDGIDGQIKICIGAEDGKINLNAIYDFKKQEFLGGDITKTWLKEMLKHIGSEQMFTGFEEFLKKRQYQLDDATELLPIKGFEIFKHALFYEPTLKKEKDEKAQLFLTDIFTVWSNMAHIDPWLLSPSIGQLLNLKRPTGTDLASRKKLAQEWVKNFKLFTQWQQDWNKIGKPIYGKDFTSLLKGIEFILNPKFDPKIFSVVSYGKVGDITQKMLAIIERLTTIEDDTVLSVVKIRKLYWL